MNREFFLPLLICTTIVLVCLIFVWGTLAEAEIRRNTQPVKWYEKR